MFKSGNQHSKILSHVYFILPKFFSRVTQNMPRSRLLTAWHANPAESIDPGSFSLSKAGAVIQSGKVLLLTCYKHCATMIKTRSVQRIYPI